MSLWAREPEVVEGLREHHENRLFLPGVTLPASIVATNELREAVEGADVVVVAVPAQHVRDVMARRASGSSPAHSW